MSVSASPSPELVATAKYAGLAYAGSMLLLWLWAATVDDLGALFFGILCFLWQMVPALAAVLLVKASRTRAGQFSSLSFVAALFGSTILTYVYCFLLAPDPQMPIFLLYLFPFYQLVAVLAFLGAALLFGWRPRDEWR